MNIFNLIFSEAFLSGIFRSTTPILLAALAALIASRVGITNMGIEGIMLFSALAGVLGSSFTGSTLVGLLLAILVGVLISLLLAFFKIKMKADEIMAGIALNMLADGGTVVMLFMLTGERATSSALKSGVLPMIDIPIIKDIPVLSLLSGHNIATYIALLSVVIVYILLFKTPLGLRIRAVGSNPHSAESVGVSVHKTQYIALAISGVFSGLAGAFMSMGYMTIFTRGMVAGRGFIGLAAANVGGRHPVGTLFSSILFGIFDNLGNNLQNIVTIPVEFIYTIPYLATIIAYSIFSYQSYKKKMKRKLELANAKEGV